MNDIMVLSLVNCFNDYARHNDLEWYSVFIILGLWLLVSFISSLIGLAFGFGTCFVFKKMKFLNGSAITETFLMFILSLFAYYICECFSIMNIKLFSIMALFACVLVHSHYTWFNFSS